NISTGAGRERTAILERVSLDPAGSLPAVLGSGCGSVHSPVAGAEASPTPKRAYQQKTNDADCFPCSPDCAGK
ncbi:hypothetical protein BaRGS_00030361, partial [Batillaria attramentaria]